VIFVRFDGNPKDPTLRTGNPLTDGESCW
jgi:hypothetical protein